MNTLISGINRFNQRLPRIDAAWCLALLVIVLVAIFDRENLAGLLLFAMQALLNTAPYIGLAVVAIGWLKASAAEDIVARAFTGREHRMIILAALVGGLAPFCSCEVIPFIAALLAAGTPVSAVMAFWLSSPVMDPPTFAITTGALGLPFAVGKTLAAVGAGILGGFTVMLLNRNGRLQNPLRNRESAGSCCGSAKTETTVLGWFWGSADRRQVFWQAAMENCLFLFKWLLAAYLLEFVMLTYVPAGAIASLVGGEGLTPVALGALAGIPAYLNGYAAPPLVAGLMEQGMNAGAAMSFMVAGAMTSIPAMAAVYALVRRDTFLLYLMLAFTAAVLSGVLFGGWYSLAG